MFLGVAILSLAALPSFGQDGGQPEGGNDFWKNWKPYGLTLGQVNRVEGNQKYTSPWLGAVLPSFSTPVVEMEAPAVSGLAADGDGNITCSMQISGAVDSAAVARLEIREPVFRAGYVYVNDELLEGVEIPTVLSNPVKLDGMVSSARFETQIDGIPLTEGTNVVEFVFTDPVSAMEGSQLVSVVVSVPGDADTPEIAETTLLPKGGAGELNTFVVLSKSQPADTFAGKKIVIGEGEYAVECEMKAMGNVSDFYLAKPGSSDALEFFLVPSHSDLTLHDLEQFEKPVKRLPVPDTFSSRDGFMFGYSLGVFAPGGDLVAGPDRVVPNVVRLDPESAALAFHAAVLHEDGTREEIEIPLPVGFTPKHLEESGKGQTTEFIWDLCRFYREDDPLKVEVPIALLTGDLSPLDLDYPLAGWQGRYFANLSQPLDVANESFSSTSANMHGFMVGALVGVSTDRGMPHPGDSESRWARPDMAEFLENTVTMMRPGPGGIGDPEWGGAEFNFLDEFYDIVWSGDSDSVEDAASLIPDKFKNKWVPPILSIVCILCLLVSSVWLLVEEFRVSLGWGFGQLGANVANCLLFIPGLIVAIIFCTKHWDRARRPVTLHIAGWVIGILMMLFVPLSTRPW